MPEGIEHNINIHASKADSETLTFVFIIFVLFPTTRIKKLRFPGNHKVPRAVA